MLIFRCVVEGVPRSVQSGSKKKWQQKVARAASDHWSESPTNVNVALKLIFFHSGDTDIDVDNIIKPISDALQGVVYVDDAQVTDVFAARRSLETEFVTSGGDADLLSAINSSDNFVFIAVDDPPDPRILP